MAEEEIKKINVITDLSNKALQEYEGLQRKHEKAAMEVKRLQEERDDAIHKLNEFQRVSHMVIEEVSTIQENLEIERTCRQSVEALASKLNRQNRSLKRKSMLLLSHLGPETIAEINLEDEDEEEEDQHAASKVCLSAQCQSTISELQKKLELALEEKKQAATELNAIREQLRETREELLKEKHDNTALIAETMQQKKLLGKYNRVSQFAVQEYEDLQENLNLERDLRAEAENFARDMLVEQEKLKRQSQILIESSSPSQALQEALSQITSLTDNMETQRLEHQHQIKQMEERLRSSKAEKELMALRCKLELVEEEKREYSEKCSKIEVEVKDLRHTVEELQKKLQAATNPPPAPTPPPPPPPPPPPVPAPTSNPLSSLLSLIRKRRDIDTEIPLVVQDSAKKPEVDIKQQAVDEMMQRIKRGVQLRPVSQTPHRRRRMETPSSSSAIQELKGIMENFNRSPPKQRERSPAADRDGELQRILLKRRGALESQQHTTSPHSIPSPAV
ncbi:shootin-1 [Myripristis murdjan]|uniref:shootin-1 n=1 Tax=Myripristis murdjan TaxID=586833 RepID=UPI001175E219|nr:shootin-1 [Myripristis murdjan]